MDAKTIHNLGEIGNMSEGITDIAGFQAAGMPGGCNAVSPAQILDQAFGGDKKFIRHGIPGADQQAPFFDQAPQPFPVLGADGKIVLQDAGLSVQGKNRKGRVLFQYGQNAVHHRHKHEAEFVQCFVPFSVPVGRGKIVDGFRFSARCIVCHFCGSFPVDSRSIISQSSRILSLVIVFVVM